MALILRFSFVIIQKGECNSKGLAHTNDVLLHFCIYQAENENQSL